MTVYKVDGIGTRKDGSGGEVANRNEGAKFIRLFVTETVAKGNCVAFDINAALDGTDSTDYGYGNLVSLANSGTQTQRQVVGIAAEAVTMSADDITNKAWKMCDIQIEGRCDFAIATNAGATAPGELVVASSADGICETYANSDVDLPFGICLADGSGTATADTKVYLINPCNL